MTDQAENNPEENQILGQVALGVESAMEHCIKRYGNLVWSIALRYVKNRSSAEDAVQETFTDIWKSAKRYDPSIATECTFIGLLARRRCIDFARRENRSPRFEPFPEIVEIPHSFIDSSSAIRCDGLQVRAALQILPDETQRIFSLHFEQGMSHPEIVEETGLPLGTVKTRLRRGLIEVRNHLRRIDGANPSTTAAP
ncbi:sigma-70 family RNA polymerase sigma factor [Akkermansiaceae bacterium]|nr:sigma-70 family RNA polymerase sigma factor [Akkermansiaceae bacterium]